MATHPSVLAWRIPGKGVSGGLPSMGWHRVGHDWRDLAAAAGTNLVFNSFPSQEANLQIIAGFNQTPSGHSPDHTLSMISPVPFKRRANSSPWHSWLKVMDISHHRPYSQLSIFFNPAITGILMLTRQPTFHLHVWALCSSPRPMTISGLLAGSRKDTCCFHARM